MKLLVDFFPIILFFAAFKAWDIYVATGVGIVATVAQIAYFHFGRGKVEPIQWVSLAVIAVFGGLTIWLQNETFIKWKPTVLYWVFGAVLLAGQVVFRKDLLKAVMGSQMELPDDVWRVANWSWIAFFAAMGAINLWVAYTFDTNTWVNFKLFGAMGLTFVFVIAQALYLGRYMKTEEAGE